MIYINIITELKIFSENVEESRGKIITSIFKQTPHICIANTLYMISESVRIFITWECCICSFLSTFM